MKISYKIFLLTIILLFYKNLYALSPEEKLTDQTLENQAMELFLEIRCLVCNGQVIENSDTKFAYDMRKFIRDEISKNKTNDEIKKNLVDRFGEDILITQSDNFIITLLIISSIISGLLIFIIFFKNKFTHHKK
jgi:cytochrome c-type biogenesis protein CcmH